MHVHIRGYMCVHVLFMALYEYIDVKPSNMSSGRRRRRRKKDKRRYEMGELSALHWFIPMHTYHVLNKRKESKSEQAKDKTEKTERDTCGERSPFAATLDAVSSRSEG